MPTAKEPAHRTQHGMTISMDGDEREGTWWARLARETCPNFRVFPLYPKVSWSGFTSLFLPSFLPSFQCSTRVWNKATTDENLFELDLAVIEPYLGRVLGFDGIGHVRSASSGKIKTPLVPMFGDSRTVIAPRCIHSWTSAPTPEITRT